MNQIIFKQFFFIFTELKNQKTVLTNSFSLHIFWIDLYFKEKSFFLSKVKRRTIIFLWFSFHSEKFFEYHTPVNCQTNELSPFCTGEWMFHTKSKTGREGRIQKTEKYVGLPYLHEAHQLPRSLPIKGKITL